MEEENEEQELDFNQKMKKRISDIEACIGEYYSRGMEPSMLIMRPTEANIFLDYLNIQTDYKMWEEGVTVSFGEDISLKIIRSTDIGQGEIYVK